MPCDQLAVLVGKASASDWTDVIKEGPTGGILSEDVRGSGKEQVAAGPEAGATTEAAHIPRRGSGSTAVESQLYHMYVVRVCMRARSHRH